MNHKRISFTSIGRVISEKKPEDPHYPSNYPAQIEIYSQYAAALKGLERNSHIWVICHYTQKRQPTLVCSPRHVDPNHKELGVLAVRTNNHPNPIGLTLTKLNKIEGNVLFVEKLDAYNGTAVLDIKPYYEHDIVFSPQTPQIIHIDPELRLEILKDNALKHHQESCPGSALAVRIISFIESLGIKPQDQQVYVEVTGDPCLADTIQGLCRARLANPSRFYYKRADKSSLCFTYSNKVILMDILDTIPQTTEEIYNAEQEQLFSLRIIDEGSLI